MTTPLRRGANFTLREVGGGIDIEPANLVAVDGVMSRGLLYRPSGTFPTVGVHLMHPRTDQAQNYNILPLVRAGYMVLGRAGRWVNSDTATVHETLLLDVAAGVSLLRERGCEKIILLGNSGGAPLASFYQAQARTDPGRRLVDTAAGDRIDLSGAVLSPADGLVLIGGHLGEGASLLKWIDPSVVDEAEPFRADANLDMYDPRNGFQPLPLPSHYEREFLERYRVAQQARIAWIDDIARRALADRRAARTQAAELDGAARAVFERRAASPGYLRIYRTMADPAFVDLSVEPDDRRISSYNNDTRPDLQNYGKGVAEFLTPEAWLSTWSANSSRAHTPARLSEITDPLLIVHYAGDVITRLSEADQMLAASMSADKQLVTVRHADHYGFTIEPDGSSGPRTARGTDAVVTWMQDRFPPRGATAARATP